MCHLFRLFSNGNCVTYIYSPPCCSKSVWISSYISSERLYFEECWQIKQLLVAIDLESIYILTTSNYLVTSTLQNIFFCVQQVWNNIRVSKWWYHSHFWMNYPFKCLTNNDVIVIFANWLFCKLVMIKITIIITILASVPTCNIVLFFISTYCSFVCHFKFSRLSVCLLLIVFYCVIAPLCLYVISWIKCRVYA